VSSVNAPDVVRHEYATEDRFLARRLAAWARLHGPLAEDAAIDAVAEGMPARVLDVGCGTGDFSERLQREAGATVVGLDLSRRMVELTHSRGLLCAEGDVQALPFRDGAFDAVVANRVLYHVPDLDRGLAEVVRVLEPGGRLVAVTYGRHHLRELWDLPGGSDRGSGPFTAEAGEADLQRHFRRVERRDLTGTASFPDTASIASFLAASWSSDEWLAADRTVRLDEIETPFTATYRHTVFLALTQAG